MLYITPSLRIDESELTFTFVRASGPGGQNINKVSTAVQLRFDVRNSPTVPSKVKERLVKLAGKRITRDGILVIEARRFRTQERNRVDATHRLVALLEKAARPPHVRRVTRPSRAAKAKRLQAKKRRGEIKRLRKSIQQE